MQNINSDPSAIEDILSGERESSHTGARIKRSTGKMVGITAAAAAIAICAGIGFSNLSRNDIQPASSLAQHSSVGSSAAEQSGFGDFELKSENIFIAKRGIKTTLTLTAKDEKARKTLQKYTNKKDGTCNIQLGCINANGYAPTCEILDETGYHYEQSSDCIVSEIADAKVVFDYYLNLHKDLNKQLKLTINAYCPSKIQPTADDIANGIEHKSCLASFSYDLYPNSPEYEFKAANGEYFCLSPFYYRTNHDVVENSDISAQSRADLALTFKRSNGNITSFTGKDFTNIGSGGIHSDSGFERQNCFTKLRDISDISEVVYGGQVFRKKYATIDEAKKAYIEATIEKQKLIKKDPNANTKEYDSAMIEAAKYIAQNKGSDILCAGLTSDKHFIAATCFSGNNAQKVKACADKMAQQGIRYNWFILIDKSGNELCKCYIDWCHMISGNAYVQIYSENAVSFAALPDGAVLRCLTDSSFADINVSLTDGDLGTTLFNNIKQ